MPRRAPVRVHRLPRADEGGGFGDPAHIAGRKAEDIVTFMREYRSGAWPSSVMGRIAKGFDDQQTEAIAAWFAAQPE